MVTSIPDLIEQFGGPAAYARAVGMTPGAAKKAKRRQSLNARWFSPTVRAAQELGLPVTLEALAEISKAA